MKLQKTPRPTGMSKILDCGPTQPSRTCDLQLLLKDCGILSLESDILNACKELFNYTQVDPVSKDISTGHRHHRPAVEFHRKTRTDFASNCAHPWGSLMGLIRGSIIQGWALLEGRRNNCRCPCTLPVGSHTKYMHFQPTAIIRNTTRFG